MNKIIFLILFIFPFFFANSQNAEQLKIDNGFDEFKFTTAPSEYSNISSYDNRSYFLDEEREVFGVPADQIKLIFTKGKYLYQIEILITDADQAVYNKMMDKMEERYGKCSNLVIKIGGQKEAWYWEYDKHFCCASFYAKNIITINMNCISCYK